MTYFAAAAHTTVFDFTLEKCSGVNPTTTVTKFGLTCTVLLRCIANEQQEIDIEKTTATFALS